MLVLPDHSQLKTEPELLAWLQQYLPGLRGVYVFGSRCRGDQLPDLLTFARLMLQAPAP